MKKNTPNVATHLLTNPDQYLLKIGKFIRKTNIVEFSYPKTAYFEYAKDIEFTVSPFYTEKLDKTFVHKLFFVDLDMWNADLKFEPFELQGIDTVFMIEQFFLQSLNTAPDPKNLFKHWLSGNALQCRKK